MEDENFMNGYGGFVSFDDDICLYQSYDSDIPDGLEPWDDE